MPQIRQNIFIAQQGNVIPQSELADIVEALQIQSDEHFSPRWNVWSTLILVESEDMIPQGAWKMIVAGTIDLEGARGYHWVDSKGVPFGKIKMNPQVDITLSHEFMELRLNPYLDKKAKAKGVTDGRDVDYLVEVADVTYADYGYGIMVKSGRKVMVSDFFYPEFFYGLGITQGAKYSHTGLAKAPRELPDGGYLSFTDITGETYQALKTTAGLKITNLKTNKSNTLTTQTDNTKYLIWGVIGFVALITTIILITNKKKK